MKSPHIINCGFDPYVCLWPPHTFAQSHSSFHYTIASSLNSLSRQLIIASLETRPSSRPLSLFSHSGLPSRIYLPSLSLISIPRRLSYSGPASLPIHATHVRGFFVSLWSGFFEHAPVWPIRSESSCDLITCPWAFRLWIDTCPDFRHHDTDNFSF